MGAEEFAYAVRSSHLVLKVGSKTTKLPLKFIPLKSKPPSNDEIEFLCTFSDLIFDLYLHFREVYNLCIISHLIFQFNFETSERYRQLVQTELNKILPLIDRISIRLPNFSPSLRRTPIATTVSRLDYIYTIINFLIGAPAGSPSFLDAIHLAEHTRDLMLRFHNNILNCLILGRKTGRP